MSLLKLLTLFCFLFFVILSKSCEEYCGPNGCDCYKVFGLAKTASSSEIKQTFRSLSLKYHPDKNKEDASAKFVEINNCYELIGDEEERAHYNQCLGYVHTDYSSSQKSHYNNYRQQQRYQYQHYQQQYNNYRDKYRRDQHNTWNNGYQQNYQQHDFRQNPRDDYYTNWGVIIPIITFILKMYFGGNEEQARPMTPADGKKMLIGYGIFATIVITFVLLVFWVPETLQYCFNGFLYAYKFCGENIWNLLVVIFLCFYVVIKLISVTFSLAGKRSSDNYFKNFFSDLNKKIDAFQQRTIEELDETRRKEGSTEEQEGYWNELRRNHLKNCEFYRNLVSEAERDVNARSGDKQAQERLKGELQRMKYDIEIKMFTNWQVNE